jgi:multicomponent K+:H+ antiporter subunit D
LHDTSVELFDTTDYIRAVMGANTPVAEMTTVAPFAQ